MLRTRLQPCRGASARYRTSSVSAIAFDAGFNDLSTFNRRFRRVMGQTPSAYRARRNGASSSEMGHGNTAISLACSAEYPGRHPASLRNEAPGGFLTLAHI